VGAPGKRPHPQTQNDESNLRAGDRVEAVRAALKEDHPTKDREDRPKRMAILCEVTSPLVQGVGDAGATIDAEEGIVAGHKLPLAEVVLRAEFCARQGIDGHQDFFTEHPLVEDFHRLVGSHARIPPDTIDHGRLTLGDISRCRALHERRDALQDRSAGAVGVGDDRAARGVQASSGVIDRRTVGNESPSSREPVNDVAEVLQDAGGAQALERRV